MIGSDPLSTEMSHSNLASAALLTVAPPALAPEGFNGFPDSDADSFANSHPIPEPEASHAKSSWLDAMPIDREYELNGEFLGIAAVNSDDNGLYRMFIGVTP